MTRLSEAEVSGDPPRCAHSSHLQDRTRIPAKVLIFHHDERPGYFGTFTKHSRLVKPRRPFARDDIALDYTYDSGAEWGEEDEGGGDDVLGDSDDEWDDEEESDDLDGWLVDGDEEEVVTPVEEREGLDEFPFPPTSESSKRKRKAGKEKETDTDGKAKKRKVVPLVPFVKGPCWETEIGGCEYEPFNQYQIQFFNGEFLSFHPCSLAKLCWFKIHHTHRPVHLCFGSSGRARCAWPIHGFDVRGKASAAIRYASAATSYPQLQHTAIRSSIA